MARETNLKGLDIRTRRKASSRAFEDMQGTKDQTAKLYNPGTPEKKTEKGIVSKEKNVSKEEPPFKARLTIRERKFRPVKTGVSIADE